MSATGFPCFDVLFHRGANLYDRNTLGMTPFHITCLNGHLSAVKKMAETGVDVNFKTIPVQVTGLMCATAQDSVHVAKFLIKSGVDVSNVTIHGTTSLTNAVSRNSHA
jgi:ankyrin repeat protein